MPGPRDPGRGVAVGTAAAVDIKVVEEAVTIVGVGGMAAVGEAVAGGMVVGAGGLLYVS